MKAYPSKNRGLDPHHLDTLSLTHDVHPKPAAGWSMMELKRGSNSHGETKRSAMIGELIDVSTAGGDR
jgi:hypothetical protein